MSDLQVLAMGARALTHTLRERLRRGPLRPAWSVGFETAVRFLREDWVGLELMPVAQARAALESRRFPAPSLRRVRRREETVAGVRCTWLVPPGADEAPGAPVLLYLHGGSYLFGSIKTHGDPIAALALACGVPALVPAYRLAPEHVWPAWRDDARAVYDALAARSGTTRTIALAGESAGGNLLIALLLQLRDEGAAAPGASAAISPWVDLAGTMPSRTQNEPYDYGTNAMLLRQAALVAAGLPLDDPRLSPMYASLAGLAPLLVQSGGVELLVDECDEFVRRARAAGVQVEYDRVPDLPHAPVLLASLGPAPRAAMERVAGYLRAGLRGPGAPRA